MGLVSRLSTREAPWTGCIPPPKVPVFLKSSFSTRLSPPGFRCLFPPLVLWSEGRNHPSTLPPPGLLPTFCRCLIPSPPGEMM